MGIEIRHATPDDAERIHRLVSNHRARIHGATVLTGMDTVERLRHQIEYSRKIRQIIALGYGTLYAAMQLGMWNTERENDFAANGWQRFKNGLRAEWPDQTALYSLAIRELPGNYRHPAVRALVGDTRVFDVAPGETLYAPMAITPDGLALDPAFQTLLAQHHLRATDRVGMAVSPGLIRAPYRARLMAKRHLL